MKTRQQRMYLFDYLMLGFPALLIVLALSFAPPGQWLRLIVPNLGFIAVIILTLFIDERRSTLHTVWRFWYPIVIVPMMYKHLEHYIHLIFPHSFDSLIVRLETALLGQPVNAWVPAIQTPWLTEIMHIAYAFYWFSIPITAFMFWRLQNRVAFEELVTGILTTFFVSYLLFILFPVYGPRFYLESRIPIHFRGILLTPTLRAIVHQGGLKGGAFPSSHVAVAVLNYLYLKQFFPRFAQRFFLPAVIMLSLGTLYGQFHYLTDVVAGVILGVTVGKIGTRHMMQRLRTAPPEETEPVEEAVLSRE